MNQLLMLPILIPFLTAIICLLTWRHHRFQRMAGLVGEVLLLLSGLVLLSAVYHEGIQSTRIGNWPAPFAIILVGDLFSTIMVVMAGLVGLATTIFSLGGIDEQRESFGYYPLLNILLMGVCGAFLTGDIFNLYVWFEVMLMASFVLLVLGGGKDQLEGAVKYVTLNLMSSALFLTGVAILYGICGSLNMAEISLLLRKTEPTGLTTAVAMMFFLAFGIKAAVFPLFFWLPASYHTPPTPVSAVFAGLLTKVGVYALIRVFTLIFLHEPEKIHTMILICSGLTMVIGVLGAMAQNEFRRLLSFHIVSQVGYMIMGLGFFTPLALCGSIFYVVHNIVAKTNLFFISGVVERFRGTGQLKDLGGFYKSFPLLSFLFLISAMALAGVPPLSGFWGKFMLIKAGFDIHHYFLGGIALFVGLLTLYSMTKIWNQVFWKPSPVNDDVRMKKRDPLKNHSLVSMLVPIVGFALLTIVAGVMINPFFSLTFSAAEQLLNPDLYIRCVLEGGL